MPTLTVVNRYPVTQHVFIDGVAMGAVGPGEAQTFSLEPGPHAIVCADSPDPRARPAGASEIFEAGYHYRYEVASH